MRGVLRRCLYILLMAAGLFGCELGVTDVGNPNIVDKPPAASPSTQNQGPSLGQLFGAYSPPQVASASPIASGSPSPSTPSVAIVLPSCKTDPQKTPSITPAADTDHIVLNDFLDYGMDTEIILANYNNKTGTITFEITDPEAAIEYCSGLVLSHDGGVSVALQCTARENGDPDCQLTLYKN